MKIVSIEPHSLHFAHYSMQIKVLLLGSTGYFGGELRIGSLCSSPNTPAFLGSILTTLREKYPNLVIHALIRKPSYKPHVEAAGATQVTVNETNDHALVRRLVSESDIVVDSADGFNVEIANDLIEGLKTKKGKGEGVGMLIHVSGATTFVDGNKEGKWDPQSKVWTVRNILFVKTILADFETGRRV